MDVVTGESNTTTNCSGSVTVTVAEEPAPNLVVESASVNNSDPAVGEMFTLSAAA